MNSFWIFTFFVSLVYLSLVYAVDYRLTIRTGQGIGTGTDSIFNITLYASNDERSNVTFTIDGNGGKLETRGQDVFEFEEKLVYPLDRLSLQRIQKKGWYSDWFINWIMVEVNETLYVFKINRWIRNEETKFYLGTLGECNEGYYRIQECKKYD